MIVVYINLFIKINTWIVRIVPNSTLHVVWNEGGCFRTLKIKGFKHNGTLCEKTITNHI